ncbi:MAG TPA: outer membrane beta-barrel protein, partial [Sphingobacteriaceae bacterium]
ATRNLPADAVDKVQVFDRKSDQAQFTGIDDGQKEKTINLELKEEKRKGAFGQLSIGGGSEERYQAKASVNKFSKEKQLSFLGMANNVNEQGFGIDDYMNFTGGSQAMMSGRGQVRIEINDDNQNGIPLSMGGRPDGVMSSIAGGANFNRDLGKKTEISSSYFYNRVDHITTGSLLRENFFTTGKLNYNESSDQDNLNNNHRFNFSLDHKVDSMNSIKFSTTLSYNQTDAMQNTSSSMSSDEVGILNASERQVESNGTAARLSTSLLWRHRFARKGRTFSANLQYSGSANDRFSTQDLRVFDDQREDRFFQDIDQTIVNKVASATLSFTEPLGKRKYLEANYSYRINRNEFARDVFDLLENVMLRNDSISAAYSSAYEYHKAGLNFRMNRKQFSLTVGAAIQNARLDGIVENLDVHLDRSFMNVLPAMRFNYNFSDNKDLSVEFETTVDEPGIQQLQPVVDNSDPLNLYVGNPDLRPSNSHNLRVNLGSFNPINFMNFNMFLEATLTNDAVAVSQSVDERGVRLSKPVNVEDTRVAMGHFSF